MTGATSPQTDCVDLHCVPAHTDHTPAVWPALNSAMAEFSHLGQTALANRGADARWWSLRKAVAFGMVLSRGQAAL